MYKKNPKIIDKVIVWTRHLKICFCTQDFKIGIEISTSYHFLININLGFLYVSIC